MSAFAAVGIVFLGDIATGGAFLALSWAQTRLDSTTTAVILTLEPLVGAGLGVALGDTWTVAIVAGSDTSRKANRPDSRARKRRKPNL